MRAFARLLDCLVYTQSRNRKVSLLGRYFRRAPDPDRGWALAALTDGVPLRLPLRRMLMDLSAASSIRCSIGCRAITSATPPRRSRFCGRTTVDQVPQAHLSRDPCKSEQLAETNCIVQLTTSPFPHREQRFSKLCRDLSDRCTIRRAV